MATVRNYGVNGLKIKELSQTLTLDKVGHADLLILQIGANDVFRFTSIQEVAENLDVLLKNALAISPRVIMLHGGNIGLAPFFPRSLGLPWSLRSKRMRSLFQEKAATTGVVYVDLYSSRKDDPFLKEINRYYAPDLIHLTGDGYRLWFERIMEEFRKRWADTELIKSA